MHPSNKPHESARLIPSARRIGQRLPVARRWPDRSQYLRKLANAKPDDDKRQICEWWQRTIELNGGIEHTTREARHTHHHAHRNRGQAREDEGAEHAQQADASVLRQRRIGEAVGCDDEELRVYRLRRRQEERLDQVQVRHGKPNTNEHDNRDETGHDAAALPGYSEGVAGLDGSFSQTRVGGGACAAAGSTRRN